MNVVVVVMDSLRADHIYGGRARTAAWDKAGPPGRALPERPPRGHADHPRAPVDHGGRRVYPFRGWHRWPDLPPQPGWEPVGIDGEMWTVTLRKAGWTTGYVTDNPHLLLPVHKRFRAKFDRVELVDGQVPGRRRGPHRVSRRELDHYLPKSLRGTRAEPRMKAYLALNPRGPRRGGLQRGEGLPRTGWAGSSGRARGSRSRS